MSWFGRSPYHRSAACRTKNPPRPSRRHRLRLPAGRRHDRTPSASGRRRALARHVDPRRRSRAHPRRARGSTSFGSSERPTPHPSLPRIQPRTRATPRWCGGPAKTPRSRDLPRPRPWCGHRRHPSAKLRLHPLRRDPPPSRARLGLARAIRPPAREATARRRVAAARRPVARPRPRALVPIVPALLRASRVHPRGRTRHRGLREPATPLAVRPGRSPACRRARPPADPTRTTGPRPPRAR